MKGWYIPARATLEAASVEGNMAPFAQFIGQLVSPL